MKEMVQILETREGSHCTLSVFIEINSEESIFPAFISLAIFPNPTGCQEKKKKIYECGIYT
jgi:hypothetical protein